MTIDRELETRILRYHHVERWGVHTIAAQLHVHHSTVDRVLCQAGLPTVERAARPSMIDPHLPFIIDTLGQFPTLTATRLFHMVRERGYTGAESPQARRQLCWSHVIRHFVAMGERAGRCGQIGQRLRLIGQAVIRTRHRLDQNRIDERCYRRRMERLRRSLRETLERGGGLQVDCRTRRQCRHLLTREPMLWTFLSDRRIELTNNAAERALRPYVIWRKLAFASHS